MANQASPIESTDHVEFSPLEQAGRSALFDVLRGIALLGIILMNIEWFNQPFSAFFYTQNGLFGIDHVTGWFVKVFIEGKFYKLFALLFGVGFAILFMRAERAQRPFSRWFMRRMFILLIIGLIHLWLLWPGDILHSYAFSGMLLVAVLHMKRQSLHSTEERNRYFLKLAAILFGFQLCVMSLVGFFYGAYADTSVQNGAKQESQAIQLQIEQALEGFEQQVAGTDGLFELPEEFDYADGEDFFSEENQIKSEVLQRKTEIVDIHNESWMLKNASYWELVEFRMREYWFLFLMLPFASLLMFLPMFLLGYLLLATGILQKPEEHIPVLKGFATVGLLIGLPLNICGLLIGSHWAAANDMMLVAISESIRMIGEMFVTMGYLGLITLLFQRASWQKILSVFAPMGRMSLTNYLLQTVILTSLFYGYAGSMFGEISRAPQMLVVTAVFLSQMVLSYWWMRAFRFGPIEWLWRSLSYGKRQPFRR